MRILIVEDEVMIREGLAKLIKTHTRHTVIGEACNGREGIAMETTMWGICLDSEAMQEGLFQTVIQYKIAENGKAIITLPETAYKPAFRYIRALPMHSPKYIYGDQVSPCNHPSVIGVICEIRWHFKLNCCFYRIKVNGRIKSKRYYDDDLKFSTSDLSES